MFTDNRKRFGFAIKGLKETISPNNKIYQIQSKGCVGNSSKRKHNSHGMKNQVDAEGLARMEASKGIFRLNIHCYGYKTSNYR